MKGAARGSRLIGALGAGALLLAGCAQGTLALTPQADPQPLLGAIGASAAGSVSLGEVYGEQWEFESAVTICPYMGPEDVDAALGFAWEGADALPLGDEGRGGLLLASESRVVAVLLAQRAELDFCSAADAAGARIAPGQLLGFSHSPGPVWNAVRDGTSL